MKTIFFLSVFSMTMQPNKWWPNSLHFLEISTRRFSKPQVSPVCLPKKKTKKMLIVDIIWYNFSGNKYFIPTLSGIWPLYILDHKNLQLQSRYLHGHYKDTRFYWKSLACVFLSHAILNYMTLTNIPCLIWFLTILFP